MMGVKLFSVDVSERELCLIISLKAKLFPLEKDRKACTGSSHVFASNILGDLTVHSCHS